MPGKHLGHKAEPAGRQRTTVMTVPKLYYFDSDRDRIFRRMAEPPPVH